MPDRDQIKFIQDKETMMIHRLTLFQHFPLRRTEKFHDVRQSKDTIQEEFEEFLKDCPVYKERTISNP